MTQTTTHPADIGAIVRGLAPKEVRAITMMSDAPKSSGEGFHRPDAEMLVDAHQDHPLAIRTTSPGSPDKYHLTPLGLAVQTAVRAALQEAGE